MFFAVVSKKKIVAFISVVLSTLVLSFALLGAGATNVFNGNAKRKLPIYCVNTSEKKVAISFDCAWGVDYTDKLLSIMDEYSVRCTFFAVEFWTTKYPEYVKKIDGAGHEIGTHSATHPHMSKLSALAIKKELTSSVNAIESITGKKVELFRAPYGEYNDLLIETANDLSLYVIQWDVDSLDWKDLTASQIEQRVLKKVKNGSIVLFHNQGKNTAQALPSILKTLIEDGYSIVPIGQLIYRENYKIGVDGAQIKNS